MLSEAEIKVNTEQIKTADCIATIDNAKAALLKDAVGDIQPLNKNNNFSRKTIRRSYNYIRLQYFTVAAV